MMVFVDTSAFIAILDADDENHQEARKKWEDLILKGVTLVCSNYILLETFALIQNRIGIKAVRAFQEDVIPMITVEWVDESIHRRGVMDVLFAARKRVSLVDWVSFDVMRRLGIKRAFTFDRHFTEQGFKCVP